MQRDVVIVRSKNVKFHASLNSDLCQVEVQQFVGIVFPVGYVHVHQIIFIQNPMSSTCHGSDHLVDVFPPCRNRYLMEWQDATVSEKMPWTPAATSTCCYLEFVKRKSNKLWSRSTKLKPIFPNSAFPSRRGNSMEPKLTSSIIVQGRIFPGPTVPTPATCLKFRPSHVVGRFESTRGTRSCQGKMATRPRKFKQTWLITRFRHRD